MTARLKTIQNSNPRAFGGARKAAALLFTLDRGYAQRLLQHLSHTERKKIAQAARHLQTLKVKDIGVLVDEFTRVFTDDVSFESTPEEIKGMFSGLLEDDEINAIFGVSEDATPVWEELTGLENTEIAKYLKKEHPQAIAYLLSQFDSQIASEIASVLPGPIRNNALRRMMFIGDVHPKVKQAIDDALRVDLMPTEFSEQRGRDPVAHMSDVLNGLSKDAVDEAMEELQNYFPKETAAIRKNLFAFEDIVTLMPQARSTVFDKIPTEQVILALKNCDKAIENAILEAMPARARRMVENELSLGVAAKEADIEAARKLIQRTVLKLADNGEIVVPKIVEAEEEETEDQ